MPSTETTPKATFRKQVIQNRRALFDFAIEERYEAGLVLVGSEVKSLRAGNVILSDSYGVPRGEELYLVNCRIAPYAAGGAFGHSDPVRPRKLLLKRKDIDHLLGKVQKSGYTLVPLSLYFKGSRAKVELALCKGKTHEDRRQSIRAREENREMLRAVRKRSK